jgi:hypothetical protein
MFAHGRFVERSREQTNAYLAGKIVNGVERAAPNVRRQVFDKPHANPALADKVNPIRLNLHRGGREVIHKVARPCVERGG